MPTKIEWTRRPGGPRGETWNPWVGCNRIAPECVPCYAISVTIRGMHEHHRGVSRNRDWTGVINRAPPSIWQAPFGWRAGSLVFSCSLSDFWHERVPLDWLAEALDIIDRTPHLTYLLLSKRVGNIARKLAALRRGLPRNTWIGATVGHPQSLPLLRPLRRLDHPVKFLSVEPLLAPMVPGLDLTHISWVICGGESPQSSLGVPLRPCQPHWVRAVRDLCVSSDTPFFFKQWGSLSNSPTPRDQELDPESKGGATLDGRLWREFPS